MSNLLVASHLVVGRAGVGPRLCDANTRAFSMLTSSHSMANRVLGSEGGLLVCVSLVH